MAHFLKTVIDASAIVDDSLNHYAPSAELAAYIDSISEKTFVHSFCSGIETESSGRAVGKANMIMRRDLAILPFLLAGKNDIVLAPPPSPEFLEELSSKLGLKDFPIFANTLEATELSDRVITGFRPFGVAGDHMRRSNISKYRDDVIVCHTLEEIDLAVNTLGPKVVIKSEYSSGGQGVRWRWDAATKEWAVNRLRQDGCVTCEPFFDIVVEVSGEFLYGKWNGISMVQVEYGIWRGQWLGNEREMMSDEVYDFVFVQRAVEKKMVALNIPERCGIETCGMDVAIVRDDDGHLKVKLLELNARVNMAHYAIAAKRRVPRAKKFNIVKKSDVLDGNNRNLVPLTDPIKAECWCAVLELED